MAVILSELTTELQTDPLGLGYASFLNAGDDQAALVLINDKTGLGAGTIDRTYVDGTTLQAAVVASEYISLTAAQQNLWLSLLIASQNSIPVNNTTIRDQVLQVWGVGTATRTNMAALQTRQGSRAEVLWGDGSVVTSEQIAKAWRG